MAGFITLPQAIMSVVGGIPVQPAGAQTVIEKLRAAKSMLPGDIGGILGQVLQGGAGSILQNPIQGILGSMQSQLGSLTSQIQGLANGNLSGLLSGITGASGLSSALGNLSNVSNALSGLASPAQGAFGLIDAIGHANIAGILGSALPSSLSLQTAMSPIMMGNQLSGMLSQVSNISTALSGASFNPATALSQINAMTAQINGVINASTNAFSTVQSAAVDIAHTTAAISALASDPNGLGAFAQMIIQPQHLPDIQQALANQIA